MFAGGFTQGVMRVMDVRGQLETHDFGGKSVADLGVPFMNYDSWEDWPVLDVDFLFGNPRCTGFSCITAGYGAKSHGPWSKQTEDVHDFCKYTVKAGIPIAIWESVQQAYSVGRPLLDYLRDELFVPAGYRIAHVFMNAASFGNCQTRRRYFFVAYRDDRNFNIVPPDLPKYHATVRDVIGDMVKIKTHAKILSRTDKYTRNTCTRLSKDEMSVVPYLEPRMCLNKFAKMYEEELEKLCPRYYDKWVERESNMPFSMHCISRIAWDRQCPTLHSGARRLVHPSLDRTLTVGELSAIMGWGDRIPSGMDPVAQLVKGVCPDAGEWLAWQALQYIRDVWGKVDFSSKYCHQDGVWKGEHHADKPVEKVFHLTQYSPDFKKGRHERDI